MVLPGLFDLSLIGYTLGGLTIFPEKDAEIRSLIFGGFMDIDVLTVFKPKKGDLSSLRGDSHGNLCVIPPQDGLPVQKFLTTTGISTGNFNHNTNYAAANTQIYYLATSRYEVQSILVNISDGDKFNQTDYGAIIGGLTNGITFQLYNAALNTTFTFFSGFTIKSNVDWHSISFHNQLTSYFGNPQTLAINIHVTDSFGKPLNMQAGDKFIVNLHDDFSGLVSHTFQLRGIQY